MLLGQSNIDLGSGDGFRLFFCCNSLLGGCFEQLAFFFKGIVSTAKILIDLLESLNLLLQRLDLLFSDVQKLFVPFQFPHRLMSR